MEDTLTRGDSFFTSAGTVLGHDRNHTFAKCRRFAAFAGFTFLAHDEAFARTGKPSANKTINDGMFNAKVLKYVVTSEKKLRALIVEQEGIVSAVVYCKQRTLMAAQLGKDQSSKELADGENGLARQVHDVDVGKGDAITMDAPEKEGDLAAESDNENDSDTTEPTDEGDSELGNTQNDGPAENGASEFDHNKTSRRAERASGPTKLQILQWRAEGMAESLAENELKDFIMPPDFH